MLVQPCRVDEAEPQSFETKAGSCLPGRSMLIMTHGFRKIALLMSLDGTRKTHSLQEPSP